MSDQSILWGHAISFWDAWGVRAMVGGAILAFLALAASLFSSFVLYRVADKAQSDLQLTIVKYAWRRIEPDRYSHLVVALKPMATLIGVFTFVDPESSSYADDIAGALNDAGFTVRRQYSVTVPMYDLTLVWSSGAAANLAAAFKEAGVPIELGNTTCGIPPSPEWDKSLPVICVGLRPRPSP